MMRIIPYVVDDDWLEAGLEDPNLRLIDASAFLRIPEGEGFPEVWSGYKAYKEEHISRAVYTDLPKDFTNPEGKTPFTIATKA